MSLQVGPRSPMGWQTWVASIADCSIKSRVSNPEAFCLWSGEWPGLYWRRDVMLTAGRDEGELELLAQMSMSCRHFLPSRSLYL